MRESLARARLSLFRLERFRDRNKSAVTPDALFACRVLYNYIIMSYLFNDHALYYSAYKFYFSNQIMDGGKRSPRRYGSKAKFEAFQSDFQPGNIWYRAIQSEQIQELQPDGTGTVLAVLDSGIQQNHLAFLNEEFVDKVLLCENFTLDKDCEDWFNHGTSCAGVALGLPFRGVDRDGKPLPDEMQSRSVAPGAKLMVCKIDRGGCLDSPEEITAAIIQALEFIVEFNNNEKNKNKVDVVSISYGFPSFDEDLARAVHVAVANNVIVVCCAANDGANNSNPITYPGRLGDVLCVGACDMDGQPSKFSSEGREIDFLDLGEDVWAPVPGASEYLVKEGYENHRDKMDVVEGTSFSTPIVAGGICVLLQDLKRLSETEGNASLMEDMHNVWCMRELLKSMTVMKGHHDNAKGYGKVNPSEYFKKGDEERIRICNAILGKDKLNRA